MTLTDDVVIDFRKGGVYKIRKGKLVEILQEFGSELSIRGRESGPEVALEVLEDRILVYGYYEEGNVRVHTTLVEIYRHKTEGICLGFDQGFDLEVSKLWGNPLGYHLRVIEKVIRDYCEL